MNENFTYCYECGCSVDGDLKGDFATNVKNVFHICGEYMYLYSVNGRQIILKADSLDELKELVKLNKFPWEVIKKIIVT